MVYNLFRVFIFWGWFCFGFDSFWGCYVLGRLIVGAGFV